MSVVSGYEFFLCVLGLPVVMVGSEVLNGNF